MENINKLQNGLFAIYSFVDSANRLQQGLPSSIGLNEVREAINIIGLDAEEILFKKHPYRAVLDICSELTKLGITDEQIAIYMNMEV